MILNNAIYDDAYIRNERQREREREKKTAKKRSSETTRIAYTGEAKWRRRGGGGKGCSNTLDISDTRIEGKGRTDEIIGSSQ